MADAFEARKKVLDKSSDVPLLNNNLSLEKYMVLSESVAIEVRLFLLPPFVLFS
jgi:hypothetical protein